MNKFVRQKDAKNLILKLREQKLSTKFTNIFKIILIKKKINIVEKKIKLHSHIQHNCLHIVIISHFFRRKTHCVLISLLMYWSHSFILSTSYQSTPLSPCRLEITAVWSVGQIKYFYLFYIFSREKHSLFSYHLSCTVLITIYSVLPITPHHYPPAVLKSQRSGRSVKLILFTHFIFPEKAHSVLISLVM